MKKWVAKTRVKEIEWPAQDTDLNTIEHLWDELEHQIPPIRAPKSNRKPKGGGD